MSDLTSYTGHRWRRVHGGETKSNLLFRHAANTAVSRATSPNRFSSHTPTTSHSESFRTFGTRPFLPAMSPRPPQKNKKRRCQGDAVGTWFRGCDVHLVGPGNQPIAFGRVGRRVGVGGGLLGGCEAAIFGGAGRGVTQQSAAKSERTHSISGGRLCVWG